MSCDSRDLRLDHAHGAAVVVLTAHFTGNRFSKNVYDVLMGEQLASVLCYVDVNTIYCHRG
jgi:hypothetical protein